MVLFLNKIVRLDRKFSVCLLCDGTKNQFQITFRGIKEWFDHCGLTQGAASQFTKTKLLASMNDNFFQVQDVGWIFISFQISKEVFYHTIKNTTRLDCCCCLQAKFQMWNMWFFQNILIGIFFTWGNAVYHWNVMVMRTFLS